MSPEPQPTSVAGSASAQKLAADLSAAAAAAAMSKKQQKKDARKAGKAAQRQQQQQTPAADAAEDPFAANYGDVEVKSKSISGRSWTNVGNLGEGAGAPGCAVLVSGFLEAIRPASKKMAFFVLRHGMSTVQCVLVASADAGVSPQMVRFATALSKESVVDVEGVVSLPKEPLKATTQQVEIQVRKIYCISRPIPTLPFNLENAARSETEFEKAEQICPLQIT